MKKKFYILILIFLIALSCGKKSDPTYKTGVKIFKKLII